MAKVVIVIEDMANGKDVDVQLTFDPQYDTDNDPTPAQGLALLLAQMIDTITGGEGTLLTGEGTPKPGMNPNCHGY